MNEPLDHVIDVEAWSETACRSALMSKRQRIEDEFSTLVRTGDLGERYLRFRFRVGEQSLSEESFYQWLVDARFSIQGELRALLVSYLNKIAPFGDPGLWYSGEDGIPPMAFAMRALVLIDSSAADVLAGR